MATQSATVSSLVPAWVPLSPFRLWIARRREYHRVADQLGAMTDRELHDIGVGRSMIPMLAREAAGRIRP